MKLKGQTVEGRVGRRGRIGGHGPGLGRVAKERPLVGRVEEALLLHTLVGPVGAPLGGVDPDVASVMHLADLGGLERLRFGLFGQSLRLLQIIGQPDGRRLGEHLRREGIEGGG